MSINLSFLKRLVKEDFSKKDQELIGKVAGVLNPALAQITLILNKGLTISDLNTQTKDLTLQVDADGNPISEVSFASALGGKCGMLQVGRAQNLTDSTVYPSGGHSVSFSEKNGQIIINNITGLPVNYKWLIRVIAYV